MTDESIKVELPGDRLYSDDCYVTPLTLADASELSLLPKTQDSKKLFDIMDRRINLDVKKLTLQDFWFLLYWQRINSYPSFPIKLPWDCPHCDEKNLHELSGSKLIIEDLDDTYCSSYAEDGFSHGMSLQTSAGLDLDIRLKVVGDELKVRKHLRNMGIKEKDISSELYESLLIACMLEPNGGDLEERIAIVKKFSAEDYYLIQGFEELYDYGVKSLAEFECRECQEVSKVTFDFNLTSFFPRVPNKQDLRARILPSKRARAANRSAKSDGVSESDSGQQHSHDLFEEPEASTGSTTSTSETEQKITMTPEELQAKIQFELSKVRNNTDNDNQVEFDSIGGK